MRQNPISAVILAVLFLCTPILAEATTIDLYFPPGWKAKSAQASKIAQVLSADSGIRIRAKVARNYPAIIKAFAENKPALVYVGSFVQAILHARGLSNPLLQGINGKEFYGSVLIAPKSAGDDPVALVDAAGSAIAYTRGASSGESGAKAASKGKAIFGTNNHGSSVNAVKIGLADVAFVKNWWWEGNESKFPGMKRLDYPVVSDLRNPDNVLTANKAVANADIQKIVQAAERNSDAFGVGSFRPFRTSDLMHSLNLMKMGKIDPVTYKW